MQTDPQLLQSYDDVIKKYLSYGIVERVTDSNTSYVHYLLYGTVARDERETTKVRAVFDASAKHKGFLSLSELLDPGPCLLPHLFDIFVRFKMEKIALISDIKQVFLQIQIDTEHRDFLRFLSYTDIRTDFLPSVLRFTRLVFGLTLIPFILNATVKFHLSQYLGQEKLKWVIEKFLQDLNVDDSTTSFDDVDDAYYFYETAKYFQQKGSFDLRKWITNNENLQHRINEHEIDYKPTDDYHKVLGLNWDYKNDEFAFDFSQMILGANKLAPT